MNTNPGNLNYVPPPKPVLNGGLFTGRPFQKDWPWRHYPAVPDAGYMMLVNLKTADPPPMGRFMLPGGGLRPGNNTPLLPQYYLESRAPGLNMVCPAREGSLGGPVLS